MTLWAWVTHLGAGTYAAAGAVVVAAGSGWYTRRQAVTATRQFTHDRRPRFTAVIESVNGGAWYKLTLRLDEPSPLSALTAEIRTKGVQFAGGQGYGPYPTATATWTDLAVGDSAVWRIDLPRTGRPELLAVRLTCAGATRHERWTYVVETPVPQPGRISV
ncbi:hypothetical protein [Actinocatenispora rupis]|uniref:Uncharacterized protein n=1 Tax=Actinocatenispora rupis TaxID=519421 RepID=A0A8J3JD64_9ACTN|nr:hypothetical protein [Actinocatenispora rupis]GID16171.1 hypothetical protein Aru02nite_70600 [Actinocatenispora rupis]